jgi:hypothetical protein
VEVQIVADRDPVAAPGNSGCQEEDGKTGRTGASVVRKQVTLGGAVVQIDVTPSVPR